MEIAAHFYSQYIESRDTEYKECWSNFICSIMICKYYVGVQSWKAAHLEIWVNQNSALRFENSVVYQKMRKNSYRFRDFFHVEIYIRAILL